MILHKKVTNKLSIKNFYTLEERFNRIHKNKYDYSKAIYINARTNITIVCKTHGDFTNTPDNHLKGHGCSKCGHAISKKKQTLRLRKNGNKTLSKSEIIENLKITHNNKYDYSISNILSFESDIEYICPNHGIMKQSLRRHFNGKECYKCANDTNGLKKRSNADVVIKKAREVHGDKYDYSKVKYTKMTEKCTIICDCGNEFEQLFSSHLNGRGCPKCSCSGFDSGKKAILYYLSVGNGLAYKIGITNKSVTYRFSGENHMVKVLKTWKFDKGIDAYNKEQQILKEYSKYKYQGVPLLKNGNTELFSVDVLNLDS